MKLFRFLLLILIGAFFVSPVFAQEDEYLPNRTMLDAAMEREITIVKDAYKGKFKLPTLQNLSALYWKLGVFDESDIKAIDNYMKINECEIFKTYYNDDIEWHDIRKVALQKISKDAKEISTKFQFTLPIYLSDYDAQRGGFEIVNNSSFPNLKRMEFMSPYNREVYCDEKNGIPDYHTDVFLIFKEQLDYTFLDLDSHIAQAFILKQNRMMENMPDSYQSQNQDRIAYARIRMNIQQYQGTIESRNFTKMAILFGEIEGLDVFEDQKQNMLLQSYDMQDGELVPVNFTVGE